LIASLEDDPSLFEPEQLRERLELLDELEIRFGDFDEEGFVEDEDARIRQRARAIRFRTEAANADVYKLIRAEIVRGAPQQAVLEWIVRSWSRDETANPSAGFRYDNRDELVSGVLQLREPSEPRVCPTAEMVFYQPTPVRHILQMVRASGLSKDDVFVDIGSGLGHVALLASVLAGVRSIGIETEAAYVESAQECAESLHLKQVRFLAEDARAADLSSGSVFYLYSPFTGSILADVLDKLLKESTCRPIKICALGPCTCTLAKERWLRPVALPDPRQITVFQSWP
jgi:hypothetical protein